jgi:hypothetical protein
MAASEQLSEQHQVEALMNDPEQLRKQQERYAELQRPIQLEELMDNPEWLRQQQELYEELQQLNLKNDSEQLGHLFEEQQLSSQLIDCMSRQEWVWQQQARYEELRQPSQVKALMNDPEQLKQQQEQQDKCAEQARIRRQRDNAGQLLGVDLSRVPLDDWSSFSAKLLNKHDQDREKGKHSYIILLDILKGGGANHVSDGERKSKEYENTKKLVVKECKKQLRRYIR